MIKKLTGRNRILKVLEGKIPDMLPFAPLLNDYFLSTLPPGIRTKDPVDGCRVLGVDVIDRWVTTFKDYYISSYFGEDTFNSEILIDSKIKVSMIVKGKNIYSTYRTPVGTLTCKVSENKVAGSTKFFEETLIKTIDDIPAYKYIWEVKNPYPIYEITKKRIDYIGNDGIAMVLIPCTPLFQLIMYDLGLEKTTYFLNDYPGKMKKLLDVMAEKAINACKIAANSPAKVGIIAENSDTFLVSPKKFGEFCIPVISEYAKIYKKKSKYLFLHACGHLKGLLEQISKIDGLSGVESLTPPLTGDVTLDYAREVLGDNMTIIGGMESVQFLNSNPEEIEIIVLKIIDKVKPGEHFILMPSDSTPAGVPVENFEAVKNAIYKYGQWTK